MTANLENIHEIYNIFCQKNRMNADIIHLFDHFHLSQTLRHLKMEKQQGVSSSLLIVLLCLFRMCHESMVARPFLLTCIQKKASYALTVNTCKC